MLAVAVLDYATAKGRNVVIRSHWRNFTTMSLALILTGTRPAAGLETCWCRVPVTSPDRTPGRLDELTPGVSGPCSDMDDDAVCGVTCSGWSPQLSVITGQLDSACFDHGV